jgi:hypothetical protein
VGYGLAEHCLRGKYEIKPRGGFGIISTIFGI